VLLVDDNREIRRLLSLWVSYSMRWEVAGESVDGAQGVMLASLLRPDAVILDLDMPDIAGWEAVADIRLHSPETKVVIYSACVVDPSLEQSLIDLGADAVVTKDRPLSAVQAALETLFIDT
jgi:CheY-like chemotaxis protein